MLSFDSCIQKSADLKTQHSTVNWVEQNKCTPASIWRMNFQQPLLLHHNHVRNERAHELELNTWLSCIGLSFITGIQRYSFGHYLRPIIGEDNTGNKWYVKTALSFQDFCAIDTVDTYYLWLYSALNHINKMLFLHTLLFSILYRRQKVSLRQLPLIQCTLSNSLNYLPPVQY